VNMNDNNSFFKYDALFDFAQNLSVQYEYEEILRLASRTVNELLQAEKTLIMMINPRTLETIKTIISQGDGKEDSKSHIFHTSISGWAIKNEKPLISGDIKSDTRFRQGVFKDIDVKSVMCVPLRSENVIFGTLSVLRKPGTSIFTSDDLPWFEKIATILSPYLINAQKIENYFKPQMPEDAIFNKYRLHGLLGKSKSFLELLYNIEAASSSDVRVLLEGKSGTGKELVAKAIHNCSERSGQKLVTVDCGTIPEHLIGSELFGHVKGAFTGATTDRKGLFEEADKGTLFMDEITNLPMDMQVNLLRVLQEGEIRPLGSNSSRKVNVRIIAAASTPLRELVEKNKFREDLFYRILVYPIHVPSLDERPEDIPLLAEHFIEKYSREQNKQVENFHPGITELLKHRNWTGNIRELENFVERMVTLAPENRKIIVTDLLPREFRKELQDIKVARKKSQKTKSLPEILSDHEKQLMRQMLVDCKWNQSSAANALGIDESTLRYKMKKYKIKRY
jgi:transcriptional regulator with GAF, ATPase, and Fis domain